MADILLVAEGSILLLSTFLRWPRKGRWASRVRKLAVVSGLVLCGLGLLIVLINYPELLLRRDIDCIAIPAPGNCGSNQRIRSRHFLN